MARLKLCHKTSLEAGVDEAGRGCLMGPVTAAAVILPKKFYEPSVNDSKQLCEKKRYTLREIIEAQSICFAVAHVSPKIIDEINILNASILAMHKALRQLEVRPKHILVDGNRFKPYHNIEHLCVVKGDSKYLNIAAASILAKTYRDDLIKQYHLQYPEYQWVKNKGYPTRVHREIIKKMGVTPLHRKSFKLLAD